MGSERLGLKSFLLSRARAAPFPSSSEPRLVRAPILYCTVRAPHTTLSLYCQPHCIEVHCTVPCRDVPWTKAGRLFA